MKRWIKYSIIAVIELLIIFYIILDTSSESRNRSLEVLIVYNPLKTKDYGYILDAYKSVLEEEGISYRSVTPFFLLTTSKKKFADLYPAVIFPDYISQVLPGDIKFWAIDYLKQGGSIAVIYDAGVKTIKGNFKKNPVFSDLLGFEQVFRNSERSKEYDKTYVQFKDKQSAELFQIPPGKMDKFFNLTTHSYGKLKYSTAKLKNKKKRIPSIIFAEGLTSKGDKMDVIVLLNKTPGNLLYVNLPLGHLKSQSDDLPIRSVIKTFLFKFIKIPHLVNTQFGKGGLIINWNLTSSEDLVYFTVLNSFGYINPDMPFSYHIASGESKDGNINKSSLNLCGDGREIIGVLSKKGSIGIHGGWGGKWFSKNLNSGNFTNREINELILKNKLCLSESSNSNVLEYSAPDGTKHPPYITKILAKNKFNSYIYTGDSGSSPNRTFFKGKMVSKNIIAFPVLPLNESASFPEMIRMKIPEEVVDNWLKEVLVYLEENRSLRVINSPLSVIKYYPNAIYNLLDRLGTLVKNGKLHVNSLSYFADYILRFLKTKYTFTLDKENLDIDISNSDGLYGITVAIPDDKYVIDKIDGVNIERKNGFYYLSFTDNIKKKKMYIYGKNN